MKIPTPVITLIVGLALAVSLLVSSMSAVSGEKTAQARASAAAAQTSAASAPAATGGTGASAAAGSSPAASPSPSASGSPGFVIPPHANYVGEVQGDLGSVAIVVHDTFAVAYFCNGKTQEAWFRGTPRGGSLSMTGKKDSSLTASYALGHARGTVTVDGIAHVFSIIAVHKPSGLFQSIAVVRGATVKAGWIVLPDGTTQIGSLEPDSTSATPAAQTAPKLDLATLTARDGDTTLTATPIDGETGSGF